MFIWFIGRGKSLFRGQKFKLQVCQFVLEDANVQGPLGQLLFGLSKEVLAVAPLVQTVPQAIALLLLHLQGIIQVDDLLALRPLDPIQFNTFLGDLGELSLQSLELCRRHPTNRTKNKPSFIR